MKEIINKVDNILTNYGFTLTINGNPASFTHNVINVGFEIMYYNAFDVVTFVYVTGSF